jgi:nitrite reductase/ring-hydroxylating ferredoxin subunit
MRCMADAGRKWGGETTSSGAPGSAAPEQGSQGLARRSFLRLAGRVAASAGLIHLSQACERSELRSSGGAPARLDFDVTADPFRDLATVGGLHAVDAGAKRLLLVRLSEARVAAFDRMCTHLACDLDPLQAGRWDATSQRLECRCHGAVFDGQGRVLQGPAPTDLRPYPVSFDPATGKGSVDLG